jgi:hypothetical protein
MPTQRHLPDSDTVVERAIANNSIVLDPDTQTQAEFFANVRKLPRSERVQVLFDAEPFDYQRKMLDVNLWSDHTRVASPIGRRGGKTYTGSAIAADAAVVAAAGDDTVIAAPYQRTADDMFDEATSWYENSPWPERFDMDYRDFFGITVDNEREYEFESGSRLQSKTTGKKGKQIRGIGPRVLMVDEAAFLNSNKIYTEVITPYFATFTGEEAEAPTSEFYLFSTTNGKQGYFYEKSIDALDIDSKWFRFDWPSSINPMISDEWIEEKRQELDSTAFEKEILAEFTDEGDVYIDHSLAKSRQVHTAEDEPELMQPCWGGLDPARGGADVMAAVLVDVNGTVKVFETKKESPIPEIVGTMKRMNQEHAPDQIYVEGNGVGGGAIDFAEEYDIWNVGEITTTLPTKSKMYQILKKRLEEGTLTLPKHKLLMNQLTDLDYTTTPAGHTKVYHRDKNTGDDIPDALAIAVYAAGGYEPTSRPYKTNSYEPVVG